MALVRARGYWSAKLGHARHEWEDGLGYSEARGTLAVADGASSSYRAQGWARQLVAAFVHAPPERLDPSGFDAWLRELAGAWEPEAHADGPAQDATPWYVAEAAVRGAFATFVGVQVSAGEEGPTALDAVRWRGVAVGDSCLLHLRDGALLAGFPLQDPGSFGATPDLVSSVAFGAAHGAQHVQVAEGWARPADALVLVTDGLASWALDRGRHDPLVWEALARLDGASLDAVVDEARRTGEMANDDVTLLRATVQEPT